MSLFWIILVTLGSVVAGTGLCYFMVYQAREVATTRWILEHVMCPLLRILVLLIVVSMIYPAIDAQSSSADFWRVLAQPQQFRDLVNLLFVAGLALAFVPLFSHPVFALPLQSMLTIALVFHWQYIEIAASISLFPSLGTLFKVLLYMLLAYFVTREASIHLSRWINREFSVDGSIRLVADAIYLVLQIPVMLIYIGYLRSQLA